MHHTSLQCLKQLAEEEAKLYPAVEHALRFDFYMDDILTGCNTIKEVIDLQRQLQTLFAKGQFPL